MNTIHVVPPPNYTQSMINNNHIIKQEPQPQAISYNYAQPQLIQNYAQPQLQANQQQGISYNYAQQQQGLPYNYTQPNLPYNYIQPHVNYPQHISQLHSPEDTEPKKHRHWNSNICDCLITNNCCKSFICPCCAFYKIVSHIDDNGGCCTSFCCLIMPCSVFVRAPYRKQLRIRYNLPAKPCNDFCTTLLCPCCALAQELTEIEHNTKPRRQSML